MSLDAIYGDREFLFLANHSAKEDPSRRVIARACRVAGFDTAERPELDKFGDLVGGNYWDSTNVRGFPSWAFAWPAFTTSEVQNPEREGGTRTRGQVQGSLVGVIPTVDGLLRDNSYDLKAAFVAGSGFTDYRLPVGYPGIVLSGTATDLQMDVFFPAGGAPLVASVHGQHPELSSLVSDTDLQGHLDSTRQAPLHDVFEVLKNVGGSDRDVLALRFGTPFVAEAPQDGDVEPGGWVTMRADDGVGASTVRYLAYPSGPFTAGPEQNVRAFTTDADGRHISPLMLSTDALFAAPANSASYNVFMQHGAPLDFRPNEEPLSPIEQDASGGWVRGRIVYDPRVDTWGRWIVEVPLPLEEEPETSGGPVRPTTGSQPRPVTGGTNPPGGFPDQHGPYDKRGTPGQAQPDGRRTPENLREPYRPPYPTTPVAGGGRRFPGGGVEQFPQGPWPQPFQAVDDMYRQQEIIPRQRYEDAKKRAEEFERQIKEKEAKQRADAKDYFDKLRGAGFPGSDALGGGGVGGLVATVGASGLAEVDPIPDLVEDLSGVPTVGRGPDWTAYPTSTRCVRVPGLVVRANAYATGQPNVGGWPGKVPDQIRKDIARSPDVAVLVGFGDGDGTLGGWTKKPSGNQPVRSSGGFCVLPPDLSLAAAVAGTTSPGGYTTTVCLPTGGAAGGGGGRLAFGAPNAAGYVSTGVSFEQTTSGLKVAPVSGGADSSARWSFTNSSVFRFDGGSTALFEDENNNTSTTVGQNTAGQLVFTGDVKVAGKLDVTEIVDPYGYGFDAVAARPSEFDGSLPGLWVDSDDGTLYFWDGSIDHALGGGSSPAGHLIADSATTTSSKVIGLTHTTSGTAAAGFGLHMDWELEDSAGVTEIAGRLAVVFSDATNTTEDAQLIFSQLVDGSLVETLRTLTSGGAAVRVYSDGTVTSPIDDAMQYRGIDTNNSAPVDGWGIEHNWILQRATDTHTTAARIRCLWEDVSAIDSQWDVTVLKGGAAKVIIQALGTENALRLPNGILEFADQGTLGTPATGYGRLGYDVTADSLRPRFVDQAGTETSLALLSDAGGGGDHDIADAATNTVSTAVDISHTTSGTAAAGFGVRQTWTLELASGSTTTAAKTEVLWTDASASFSADVVSYAALSGALVEYMRYDTGDNLVVFPVSDTSTTSVVRTHALRHTISSGTPAAGLGTGMILQGDLASGGYNDLAYIDALLTDATNGSHDADLRFTLKANNSDVEALRLDADGDGAGGTATAVRVTQGRLDLMEQATPGTPVTNAHRVYVDDETTFVMDEAGERRALDNVVLADAASETVQTSGGAGNETLKTVTMAAGYLATNGDGIRIRAAGRKRATTGSAATNFYLELGSTTVAAVNITGTTAARVWFMDAIIVRTGATAQTAQTQSSWGTSGTGGATVELQRATPSETLANALAININAQDGNSEDAMTCDFLIVEPLIRA